MARSRYLPDNFTLALVAVVTLASLLAGQRRPAHFFERLTTVAIGLLFFLHGAKLSREAILGGITHWRLHLLVFASTFVLFPLLGLLLQAGADAAGHARALHRRALPVRAAGDGAVGDRLHLDRARQHSGGRVQRVGLDAARRLRDAGAGQPARRAARRRGRVARRDRPHPAAADGALRRRPPAAPVDRRLGQAPRVGARRWSIAGRSCWWSTPPSARR